jgi:hypothetical protein
MFSEIIGLSLHQAEAGLPVFPNGYRLVTVQDSPKHLLLRAYESVY